MFQRRIPHTCSPSVAGWDVSASPAVAVCLSLAAGASAAIAACTAVVGYSETCLLLHREPTSLDVVLSRWKERGTKEGMEKLEGVCNALTGGGRGDHATNSLLLLCGG